LRVAKSNVQPDAFPAEPVNAPQGAIGLLGGIFDPVHYGHLAVARLAIDCLGLKKLLFIPSGRPPHKVQPCAGRRNRLAMLRIAIKCDRRFGLWDGEVRRKGTSFTIETLDAFTQEFPDRPLYFVIGSDNLPEIRTWRRYREILDRIILCVAERPGHAIVIPRSLPRKRIMFLPSPQWGISSTRIRYYLKHGYTCRHMVPERVLDYISKNRLYH
jgi:nicotinate-nucleotide adenylyltransferase